MNDNKYLRLKPAEMPASSDEIDLFEIVKDLIDYRRWIVIAIVLGGVLASVTYHFTHKQYVSDGELEANNQQRLIELNNIIDQINIVIESTSAKNSNNFKIETIDEITPNEILIDVIQMGSRDELRRKFFNDLISANLDEVYLSSSNIRADDIDSLRSYFLKATKSSEESLRSFYQGLSLNSNRTDNTMDEVLIEPSKINLAFSFSDPVLAAKVANAYGELLRQAYDQHLKSKLVGQVDTAISKMRLAIDILRQNYDIDTQLRIIELREALNIATVIEQKEPIFRKENLVLTNTPPLYTMGIDALNAELEQLLNRSSNQNLFTLDKSVEVTARVEDQHVSQIVSIQAAIQRLKSIDWNWPDEGLLQWEKRAIPDWQSEGVQYLTLLLLSVFLSGIFAVISILIHAAWRRHNSVERSGDA